jgi:hypothetical protein
MFSQRLNNPGTDPEGKEKASTAGCTLGSSAKLISTIINERIQAAVTFHDGALGSGKELCNGHYRGEARDAARGG